MSSLVESPQPTAHQSVEAAHVHPNDAHHTDEGDTLRDMLNVTEPWLSVTTDAYCFVDAPPDFVKPSTHSLVEQEQADLRRFRFSAEADLLLLKAVSRANAHVAQWGRKEEQFEEALKIFLNATQGTLLDGYHPSGRTLADRFKRILEYGSGKMLLSRHRRG